MVRTSAKALGAALAVALIGAVAPASIAQAAPAAAALAVSVVSANGSGCPNSAAEAHVQGDGSTFTIDFSGYYAYTGSDAPATAVRRNCQFSIQVTPPAGKTYAVEGAEYSGFGLLSEGITGVQSASYYIQGQTATTTVTHRFTGPFHRTWKTTDAFGDDELAFAACGVQRLLNVNTDLRLTPQPADASLNILVMDPTVTLHLTYKNC
jgi:hypothetical protein